MKTIKVYLDEAKHYRKFPEELNLDDLVQLSIRYEETEADVFYFSKATSRLLHEYSGIYTGFEPIKKLYTKLLKTKSLTLEKFLGSISRKFSHKTWYFENEFFLRSDQD